MRLAYIIIAILLGIDNVFISFRVGSLSYDRLLEFVLFFLFFKSYLLELKTNPFFKKYNTFLLLFAVLQFIMNLKLAMVGKIEFEEVYIGLFKCFSFLVFSYLFLLIAKKDIKYINIILLLHFAICMFAFLQHPISPIAPQMLEIKKSLFSSVQFDSHLSNLQREGEYIAGGHVNRFRLAGPFSSTINFSYFAISSVIISFYMYLRYQRRFYLTLLVVLFVASLLTQTRSLLLAEICLVFGYFFFAPLKRHGLYKLAMVTGAIIAILFVYTSKDVLTTPGNSRISKMEGDSRPLLWVTGLYAVINYPLGITKQDYFEIKKEMFRKYGNPDVLHLASHNGLVNVGFKYTIFGYLLFFFLVLFLLRNINLLEPKYIVFFKLALFSYLINASFHNNFILNADYPFLMVLMLINIDHYYQSKNKTHLDSRYANKTFL